MFNTMNALVYTGPEKISFKKITKPKVGAHEVLIKIKNVGICGTDLHIYHGGMKTPLPLVMGHEFSGTVAGLGAHVTGFKIGDKVTGEHVIPCKKCNYCLPGKPNLCQAARIIGLQRPGALAEYLVLPAELTYRVPEKMTFEEAAMVEPLSIAVYAIKEIGLVLDKNVAVIGQGPIGLLLDQLLKAAGANVVGIDVLDHRLQFPKKYGWVDKTINSKRQNVAREIEKFCPGGADITFEVVGRDETAELALEITRRNGEVILLGVFEKESTINLMHIVKKELNLHGSWTCAFSFPEAIDLIAKGKIDVKKLITHRYAAADGAKAFADASSYSAKRIKTIINF